MDETKTNDGLKYVGDGTVLLDVPARDLTGEEVEQFGRTRLLSSRLYVELKKAYAPKPTKSAMKGGVQAEKE